MQSDFSKNVCDLSEIYGIVPENENVFRIALTHSSYTKENAISSLENYERLEFLGDAVLKLCMSDILYKLYPDYDEGEMSRIRSIVVSDNILAKIARKIKLSKCLILGAQEEKNGGRKRASILACAFEAILGAYYLEGKFKEISSFLDKEMQPFIKEVDENKLDFNAKAVLQEYTQGQTKERPVYNILREEGPDHDKTFVVEVVYEGKVLAEEKGKTKKEAEQNCAKAACERLGIK
jgi:ribonuclease-3